MQQALASFSIHICNNGSDMLIEAPCYTTWLADAPSNAEPKNLSRPAHAYGNDKKPDQMAMSIPG